MPELTESAQRDIAAFLDRECEHISRAEIGFERLYEALNRGRNEILAELLRDRESVPLKRVGVRVSQGWSPQAEERVPEANEAGILKLSAVSTGVFDPNQAKALPVLPEAELQRYSVHAGDLLMVRASGSLSMLGRACLVACEPERPLLYPDIVYRLECRDPALPAPVLLEILATPQGRDAVEMLKRGAANNKVRIEDVRNMPVPLPSTEHVAEIERRASELDRATRGAREQGELVRTRLVEYRESLIHEAVFGQLDVPRLSDQLMAERLHAASEDRLDEVTVWCLCSTTPRRASRR